MCDVCRARWINGRSWLVRAHVQGVHELLKFLKVRRSRSVHEEQDDRESCVPDHHDRLPVVHDPSEDSDDAGHRGTAATHAAVRAATISLADALVVQPQAVGICAVAKPTIVLIASGQTSEPTIPIGLAAFAKAFLAVICADVTAATDGLAAHRLTFPSAV